MRRFEVTSLPEEVGQTVALDPRASHHLLRVCRHPRGAPLWVFDGRGRQAKARLAEVRDDDTAVIEITEPPVHAAPDRPTWVILAVLKGSAMERALRMGTEAGATHFVPVISERTVARGDRHGRWERVLASAAQQCGRADLPRLSAVTDLHGAIATLPEPLARFVASPSADDVHRAAVAADAGAVVAIGPEGGWTAREVEQLVEQGFTPLGLGSWVLRADTAVAVAVATLA